MYSQVFFLLAFLAIAQGFYVPRPRVIKVPIFKNIYKPYPVVKKVPVFRKKYVPIVKPVPVKVPKIVPVYVEKEVQIPVYIEKDVPVEVPMETADPALDLGISTHDADSVTINANVAGLTNLNNGNAASAVNIASFDADHVNIDLGFNGAVASQVSNTGFQNVGTDGLGGQLNNAV